MVTIGGGGLWIIIDFLEKGKTTNGEYCANLLHLLYKKMWKKQSHLVKKSAVSP